MKKICFIGCVKLKTPEKNKVEELYCSPLFKLSLKYAKSKFDEVAVLSAKHGVLDLDVEIEPYEVTLNNMKADEIKEWSKKVTDDIKNKYPPNEYEYYFIAGKKYHKYLDLDKNILFPLPIGKKMQKLKEEINNLAE